MNYSKLPIGNAPREATPEYLTFTNVHATDAAHISMNTESAPDPYKPVIYWSKNKYATFTLWDYSEIELLPGESVYMYGDNPDGINKAGEELIVSVFVIVDGEVEGSGNIQTLRDINARKRNPLPELPGDYVYLFSPISEQPPSLTKAPELPATKLAIGCYACMFFGAVSLRKAPKLPAVELEDDCYSHMFVSCLSLEEAPDLPAKQLKKDCYLAMFGWCLSLRSVKALFESVPDTEWLEQWLYAAAMDGNFYKSPNAIWTREEAQIPESWTIVNV